LYPEQARRSDAPIRDQERDAAAKRRLKLGFGLILSAVGDDVTLVAA
jgi:hypothetical protein